jgi:site-specific recombinase XerD
MKDTKYLKPRHNVWYFQRRVPVALESLYPNQAIIERSLSSDIREARQMRDVILGQMRQQELDLQNSNPEKLKFQEYMTQMKITQANGNIGSNGYPLFWNDVMDPHTARKEDDVAYQAAFSAMLKGQETHQNYRLSLKETLAKFIAESKAETRHTPETLGRYSKTISIFLSLLNHKDFPLEDINREQALNFISHHRTRVSGATLYSHISRLKTLWEYAYRHAWIKGDNPFDRHTINTTKDRKKKQPFTPEETVQLLHAIKQEKPSMRLLVWLGLYSGARISELVSVSLSSIKEEDGLTMIGIATEQKGKTESATRHIPVPQRCLNLFEEIKTNAVSEGSSYLFHDLVTQRDDARLGYGVTKAFGAIKKKYITTRTDKGFHSFRVMMATVLQRAGVSELIAAYMLGHSKKGLTMSYGYYSKGYSAKQLSEAQDKAVAELDRFMKLKGDDYLLLIENPCLSAIHQSPL